jgi:branched-chain amino acid transport system permease protein
MAAAATGVFHTSYRQALRLRQTRAEYARLGLAALAVVAAPFVLDPFWLTVADQIGIAIVGAVGLNLLTGSTGLISLGQGGFLAIGAYTSAILTTRLGVPWPLTMLAAVAASSVVGAFFGLPALRLKGLYLTIATIASQAIVIYLVVNWTSLTGGVNSLVVDRPRLLGLTLSTDFAWYWVIAAVAVVAVVSATNLLRTGLGRAFMAIRDQDVAAEAIGIPVGRYKVLAFVIAAGYAGLAGALIAQYTGIVTYERFGLDVSILYLAIIIIGGLGSVSGAIYGSVFMIGLPAYIQQLGDSLRDSFPLISQKLPAIQLVLFGTVMVLFLLLEPRGLARLWQRARDYFRLWPFRY